MAEKTHTPVSPIYAVCGGEPFLKRQAIDRVVYDVLGDADRSLALSEYECATSVAELAGVLDDLRTLPFLSERRLVMSAATSRCRRSPKATATSLARTGGRLRAYLYL